MGLPLRPTDLVEGAQTCSRPLVMDFFSWGAAAWSTTLGLALQYEADPGSPRYRIQAGLVCRLLGSILVTGCGQDSETRSGRWSVVLLSGSLGKRAAAGFLRDDKSP